MGLRKKELQAYVGWIGRNNKYKIAKFKFGPNSIVFSSSSSVVVV